MNAKLLVLAAATVLALPSAAFGLPATVVTDVALRTGPGPAYPVIGTIDRQAIVEVEGCVDAGTWCRSLLERTHRLDLCDLPRA